MPDVGCLVAMCGYYQGEGCPRNAHWSFSTFVQMPGLLGGASMCRSMCLQEPFSAPLKCEHPHLLTLSRKTIFPPVLGQTATQPLHPGDTQRR
jgi:hypothetical protein